eukprot:jgi/Mesvir1/11956/Mv00282-RA.1
MMPRKGLEVPCFLATHEECSQDYRLSCSWARTGFLFRFIAFLLAFSWSFRLVLAKQSARILLWDVEAKHECGASRLVWDAATVAQFPPMVRTMYVRLLLTLVPLTALDILLTVYFYRINPVFKVRVPELPGTLGGTAWALFGSEDASGAAALPALASLGGGVFGGSSSNDYELSASLTGPGRLLTGWPLLAVMAASVASKMYMRAVFLFPCVLFRVVCALPLFQLKAFRRAVDYMCQPIAPETASSTLSSSFSHSTSSAGPVCPSTNMTVAASTVTPPRQMPAGRPHAQAGTDVEEAHSLPLFSTSSPVKPFFWSTGGKNARLHRSATEGPRRWSQLMEGPGSSHPACVVEDPPQDSNEMDASVSSSTSTPAFGQVSSRKSALDGSDAFFVTASRAVGVLTAKASTERHALCSPDRRTLLPFFARVSAGGQIDGSPCGASTLDDSYAAMENGHGLGCHWSEGRLDHCATALPGYASRMAHLGLADAVGGSVVNTVPEGGQCSMSGISEVVCMPSEARQDGCCRELWPHDGDGAPFQVEAEDEARMEDIASPTWAATAKPESQLVLSPTQWARPVQDDEVVLCSLGLQRIITIHQWLRTILRALSHRFRAPLLMLTVITILHALYAFYYLMAGLIASTHPNGPSESEGGASWLQECMLSVFLVTSCIVHLVGVCMMLRAAAIVTHRLRHAVQSFSAMHAMSSITLASPPVQPVSSYPMSSSAPVSTQHGPAEEQAIPDMCGHVLKFDSDTAGGYLHGGLMSSYQRLQVCQMRAAVLMYLKEQSLGVTIYGSLLDRDLLRSFHMIIVASVIFLTTLSLHPSSICTGGTCSPTFR